MIEPQRPFVGQIKAVMRAHGAQAAMMSGSGPSVWGLFARAEDAEGASEALLAAGARAYVCEMIAEQI